MKNHILNLFRLQNIKLVDFSYRLVQFDINFLDDNLIEQKKCLDRLETVIASDVKGPAAVIYQNGAKFIAIPAGKNLTIEQVQANANIIPVKLLEPTHKVDFNNKCHKQVVWKMLDFEIRRHLKNQPELWSLNTYQFYLKTPMVNRDETDIDIFPGFVYRLVEDHGEYYISLNPTFKYVGKETLSTIVNNSNVKDRQYLKGEKCLYQNGDDWYQVEIRGFGKGIAQQTFIDQNGKSRVVKDYILQNTGEHKTNLNLVLKNDDLALLYKYPNRDVKDFFGATSLARILYGTEHREVQSMHRLAILAPYKRFRKIEDFIKAHFHNIRLNNRNITVSTKPVEEKLSSFSIPALKYNYGHVLKVQTDARDKEAIFLGDFGFERKNWIKNHGIETQMPFSDQFLIVPRFVNYKLAAAFQKNIEGYLKNLTPNFPGFKLVTYEAKPKASATEQVNAIHSELVAKRITSGNALFLLPFDRSTSNRRIKNFHDCLKNKFFPNIKFQCASIYKVESYYNAFPSQTGLIEYKINQSMVDKFMPYMFNLVMEYLIINRVWPYSLEKNLNFDIYIGIDVHERYAGFTFFYKNGEHIVFDHKAVPLKAGDNRKRAEKIKEPLITEKLLQNLREQIPLFAQNPNGIVIVRDGKSFGQEEIALEKVIDTLSAEGLLNKQTIETAVVDLHKQTAYPLRSALKYGAYEKLDNVYAGTYKIIDSTSGFIFNTGYPFKIRGTANPIFLNLRYGNANFTKIMKDIFAQTILAFSAPDLANSIPVCIKLIDSFLVPITANFRDTEPEMEETEILEFE